MNPEPLSDDQIANAKDMLTHWRLRVLGGAAVEELVARLLATLAERDATIQQLRDALGDVRWRAGSFGLHCASCGVPEGRPHNAECPIDALLGQP